MLESWARLLVRRKRTVLALGFVILVLLAVTSLRFGGDFSDNFRIPGSEAQRAFDLLEERFQREAGSDARLVWVVDEGDVLAASVRAPLEQLLRDASSLDGVLFVSNPYESPGAISADQRSAFATIRFDGRPSNAPQASVAALVALVEDVREPGLRIEAGGEVIADFESEGLGKAELIGLAAAAIVLLVAFGSIVAMGLPLVTALLGLGVGFLLIRFAAIPLDISSFAPSFAAMLGIGVGIDYALFVTTRFREGLAAGWTVERSVIVAMTTAGRSVAFAGVVVVVALLGLYAIGIPFVANLGLSAAIVVLVAVVIALTILPALLLLIGHNIDRWSVPIFRGSPGAASSDPATAGFWFRFSTLVQRHAVIFFVLGTGVLLVLSVPLLSAELGTSDEGNNPESFASRRAYDLLVEGFGPGFNGPFILVVEDDQPLDGAALARLAKAVSVDPNVAAVLPPSLNSAGDTAVITVIPGTSPQDGATRALVSRLRSDTIPAALSRIQGSPAVFVAGSTAAFVDVAERIEDRLALFFLIVVGFAMVLLLVAFRSVTLPIKAALLNLLAISASMGVVIAIFQWGWGRELIGLDQTGPIESFLPMFMFAILFGLSMDYEVFLLSRIRERYLENGDPSEAVAHGISTSARVITAAAAILVTVFGSFVFGDERVLKEFGLGLAFAIFIDATLVRLVLVPAVMQLMGRASWWMPAWLDRLLPSISVDPVPHDEEPADRAPSAPLAPAPMEPSPLAIPARFAAQVSLPVPPPTKPQLRPRDVERPGWGAARRPALVVALALGFLASYRLAFARRRRPG